MPGDDCTSKHQDQGFSEGAPRVESKESVFIVRLGAARPLVLQLDTDEGEEVASIQMDSCDCYELTGFVITNFRHGVPAVQNCGRTITLLYRLVRNKIHPGGDFAFINGKRVTLGEEERTLSKRELQELQQMCSEQGLDETGAKAVLAQRLTALPTP